jgi:hypothetical protein
VSSVIDTCLCIPGDNGAAAGVVRLALENNPACLPDLRALLYPEWLDMIDRAVQRANQPHYHARVFVSDAIAKLREGEYVSATPLLVNGAESLFRATARSRGIIDAMGVIQPGHRHAGKKAVGRDLVLCLPINKRVQRMLTRFAFGDAANTYRRGGEHPTVSWKEQCTLWLLAIIAWLDGYGFLPAPIV